MKEINLGIIKKSQEIIGQDPDFFVDSFYEHFLAQNSELSNIFRNTDLRVQKLELIKGFLTIFSMLNDPLKLNSFLVDLGTRHVCYEIQSHHYSQVLPSLLYAVKCAHKENWNDEVEKEWSFLCSFIINKMKEGSLKVKAA